jgi:hypothetical protein
MLMPEFDAYLMVDWSASSRPARGSDSVWYCLVVRTGCDVSVVALQNPATRHRATAEITDILRELVCREQMVLVGYDFPFGYPSGFLRALGVTGTPAWLSVWREIAGRIVDRDDNSNNRFAVAGELNRCVSESCYPFWGCPRGRESATMSRTKGGPGQLAEKRLTDTGNMQPVWKLYGNGSVGSQALVGLPHLTGLRSDVVLAPVSRVWPFETGLGALPDRRTRDYLLVYAEIYPSLLPNRATGGDVKDAVQVKTMATHFAALDDAGELSRLFAGPACLSPEERERIEQEEGWTLGVLTTRQEQSRPASPSLQRSVTSTANVDRNTTVIPCADEEDGLPKCDFVYFATPACGSWTITADFVDSAKAIIAHAYNTLGLRMPLVQHLRPGHQILLAYGSDGNYTPVFRCQVCASPEPLRTRRHTFDVFCYIPDPLHERLQAEGYQPDPVVERFVGIAISAVQDLRNNKREITKPKGNNTLRRWDEVFPGMIGEPAP